MYGEEGSPLAPSLPDTRNKSRRQSHSQWYRNSSRQRHNSSPLTRAAVVFSMDFYADKRWNPSQIVVLWNLSWRLQSWRDDA